MLKWEKKLIAFLEKHMVLLAALLVSLIALYLRRANIWYHTEDCFYYFDSHEGNIQSALYYLIVKLVSHGFDLPLHGVKWIAGLADFGVAFLAVLICAGGPGKLLTKGTDDKIKLLALYAACLFVPTIYVRGCVWAQVDSVAMVLLLAAVCCKEYLGCKGKMPAMVSAVILAAIGAAMYPPFMLLIVLYCLYDKSENSCVVKYLWLAVAVIAVVIECLSSFAIGITWQSGMQSFIRWTTWHPLSGVRYTEVGEWMWQQLLLFAYSASVISLLAAFRKKMPYWLGIVVQLITMLCFSVALGWQYSI